MVEIPLKKRRYNPYEDDMSGNYEGGAEMDNLIGLVESDIDMGLCYRLDLDYKNKEDQWSDYLIKWHDGLESFEKLCKDLKIDIVYETNKV